MGSVYVSVVGGVCSLFLFRLRWQKLLLLFLLSVVLSLNNVHAQYYISGQEPSKIRWRQIETEKFLLIYPDFYEERVKEFSLYCDTFAWYNLEEMDMDLIKKQKKTPVIFHSVGSYSNGLSVWAPKRIEFWTAPPQNTYSQQWLQQLLLHEYRHELQMQALNQSAVGVLTSVFGEHVVGAVAGLFVPMWYLEGDATWAETILSTSGRGRNGNFISAYRALSDKESFPFNYNKATFGSYKDYVPGNYDLGYLLVAYDRITNRNYWKNGYQGIASKFWTLNSMYKGNFVDVYDSAMLYWKNVWDSLPSKESPTAKTLVKHSENYSNYYVAAVDNGNVMCAKTSFVSPYSLVKIDSGYGEQTLTRLANIYDNYFSAFDSKLVYTRMVPDKRWDVMYNNLEVYDMKTDNFKLLTEGRNIFSPSFSSGGSIVALEVENSGNTNLLIFDSLYNQIRKILLPVGNQYSYPVFGHSEDTVFLIAVTPDNTAVLAAFDVQKHSLSYITSPTTAQISRLTGVGEYLYFLSDVTNVSQIYSYHLPTGKICMQTMSCYGVGSYAVDANGYIVYSDYTANGYVLKKDSMYFLPSGLEKEPILPLVNKDNIPVVSNGIDSVYASKPYSKWRNLFKYNGWLPVSLSPSQKDVDLGMSLFSQNLLSSSVLSAGWLYDYNSMKNKYYLDYDYLGWYPKINVNVSYSGHEYNVVSSQSGQVDTYQYHLLQSSVGASVPLMFTTPNHFFYLEPVARLSYAVPLMQNPQHLLHSQTSAVAGIAFQHHTQKPYRYIHYPWLQSVGLSYIKSFSSVANALVFNAYLYFPSPIATHSLWCYLGWINVFDGNPKQITTSLKMPRGYRYINPSDIDVTGNVNYTLPLWYTDWSLRNIAYVKRLYANVFLDCAANAEGSIFHPAKGKDYDGINQVYTSCGLELYANCNLFQISTPLTVGVRAAYLQQLNSVTYDFLFSIDL